MLSRTHFLAWLFLSFISFSPLWADWSFGPNERVNDDTVRAYQDDPSIAVDGKGNVYCVWEDWRNGYAEVYFVYKPVGNPWSKNERVLNEIPNANPGAEIRVGEYGSIYCIFCARYGTVERDVYFTERISEGMWSAPIKINDDSGDNSQVETRLAIDDKENLYALWLDCRNTGPSSSDLYFSMKPKGGNWTANEKVNDVLGGVLRPSLAVDSAGNCYAVWEDARNYDQYRDDIYFSFRPKGGSWGSNIRVNNDLDTMEQEWPELAVDLHGNAHCVWVGYYEDHPFDTDKIYYSFRPVNGNWTKSAHPEILAGGVPSVVTDKGGNLYALWNEAVSADTVFLYFSCLPLGGEWTTKIRVTDDKTVLPDYWRLAVDSSKKIYCVWADWRNNNPPTNPADIDIYFCDGEPTGITEKSRKMAATGYSLDARPNPMKDFTRIQFGVPNDLQVTLKIYDISGRLLYTIFDGNAKEGEVLIWNRKNGAGRKVGNGIYFIRLETNQSAIIKKVIVID